MRQLSRNFTQGAREGPATRHEKSCVFISVPFNATRNFYADFDTATAPDLSWMGYIQEFRLVRYARYLLLPYVVPWQYGYALVMRFATEAFALKTSYL